MHYYIRYINIWNSILVAVNAIKLQVKTIKLC